MGDKIGVFICSCGDNIGGVVDVEAMADHLGVLPDVDFAVCHGLLCAPDGKAFLAERMRESGARRAVVAACSPKDHEAGFQRALEEAGINRYLLQMANIREHCSWVTPDPGEAFGKALAMVNAAISRVRLHEALERKEIDVHTDVLVIGGGLAGIEAALLAAEAGRTVYLVERSPTLGGMVPELEEVAPNMECAPCMISPRLSAVEEEPRVQVLTDSRVTRVLGYFGNFQVEVERRARLVDEEMCIGCDECIEACPVSVPSPFHRGLGERKAIDVPFPGCVPNCAVVDRAACIRVKGESCEACIEACPMEAMDFDQEDEVLHLEVGSVVVATGARAHEPTGERLGLGTVPEVYTLAQAERLFSSNGPTGGQLQRRDGSEPSRVVLVHCAGRDELGYCSGFCCSTAMKLGVLARKAGVEVIHLHTDLVAPGSGAASLRDKASAEGSRFVATGDPARTAVTTGPQGPEVRYLDPAGHEQVVQADMVVLVTGLVPGEGTEEIARILDLSTDPAGFPTRDHPILRPAAASVEGVFLAGTAAGPADIATSIATAHAAAGQSVGRLQPGRKLAVETLTAHAVDELCSKCLFCVSTCPYQACRYDAEADRVEVNEVLCHGCGACVAACPSGAAEARHFTDDQLSNEISEVLRG